MDIYIAIWLISITVLVTAIFFYKKVWLVVASGLSAVIAYGLRGVADGSPDALINGLIGFGGACLVVLILTRSRKRHK